MRAKKGGKGSPDEAMAVGVAMMIGLAVFVLTVVFQSPLILAGAMVVTCVVGAIAGILSLIEK